ncbi:MAG TPA: FecR domain-containing protein, partial [Chitinophagaceae bacterium]|nr:FecR domain-containing protein [Chitinophagaceae bacterium]
SDGRKIYLDSVRNGTIAIQNNTAIIKNAEGKLEYNVSDLTADVPPLAYNTLTNPRGSKLIDMLLSDGSHVWLNAESSITFPVAFAGNERRVTITGEAYFEVKHDDKMPFRVNVGKILIEDLGTEFNVNSYEAVVTTLVKGKVQIGSLLLAPGDQAAGEKLVAKNVDLNAVTAWKTGWFEFQNMKLSEVMKQISRWYDVDVTYEGKSGDERFGGRINKDLALSEVMRTLNIKYKAEGKKLTVTE